jgi:hypothetical protein
MSEPNQLYARVRISRDRYTPDKIREQVVSGSTTVRAWVDAVIAPGVYGFPMPSLNAYDDVTQTWTLGVLDFSENYDDYTAAVAVFREIVKFKDVPGDDCMLVFAFLFGSGGIDVALRIGVGASEFLDEDAAAVFVPEAEAAMQALMDRGAAQAGG